MTNQAEALSYAVRPRVLLKYFGQLLIVLAALTLFPLVVSLFFGEIPVALRYSIVVTGLAILGWAFSKTWASREVQVNEGIVLVASIFLASPLVMTYPLMGSGLTFTDAFFEAVSGVTTTGLSTLGTVENKPHAFLFSRAWMQWYGGLGIMILSLALLFRPGMVAKRLSVTEAIQNDLVGGTKAHARRVFTVYGTLTLLGIALLLLTGLNPYDALLYTLASVSTGGYAPYDSSLNALGSVFSQWAVIALCLACAVPLPFYHAVFRERRPSSANIAQFRGLLIAGLAASCLLAFALRVTQQTSWMEILRKAPILALSAQTTAGFSNAGMPQLHASAKLVLILAMALGGGIGSTAGGFKILRLLTFLSLLRLILKKTRASRHAVLVPRVAGQKVEDADIHEGILIVILFVSTIVISWVPFVFMGYSPIDSLFEVASATGTVGLSSGVTGGELPGLLKGILCADMLLGRLEILAWLVVVYPRTWLGRRI